MIEAYPLQWPIGYKRIQHPSRSRFKVSGFGKARDFVISEIKRMNGTQIIISSNIPLKKDGFPYATFSTPEDKGVAVYFLKDKVQYVFACDAWNRIEDNIYSIGKTIEAMRAIDRWGVSEMMERSFTGFKAIPEKASDNKNSHSEKPWWEILGVHQHASVEQIRAAFRDKAKIHHPDAGGDSQEFILINEAYRTAIDNKL